MQKELNILSLGDIHHTGDGTIAREMATTVIPYISEHASTIDLIVFDGDYFDHLLTLSNGTGAMTAMGTIMAICCHEGIQLVLMKGTASHDLNQLEVFRGLTLFDNIRVVDKATSMNMFGREFLFIPEEYPKDFRQYYADTVFDVPDNHYAATFLHGTVKSQAWASQIAMGERQCNSAPVWDEVDLMRITSGPVMCGHIHKHTIYKGQLTYHGPFTCRNFGDAGVPKGWIHAEIWDERFTINFIENSEAPEYTTVDITDFDKLDLSTVKEFCDTLIAAKQRDGDRLRLLISHDYSVDNPEIVALVRSYLKGVSFIAIPVTSRKEIQAQEEEALNDGRVVAVSKTLGNEDLLRRLGRFSFLIDPNLTKLAQLIKYVEVKDGITISTDELNALLTITTGE